MPKLTAHLFLQYFSHSFFPRQASILTLYTMKLNVTLDAVDELIIINLLML